MVSSALFYQFMLTPPPATLVGGSRSVEEARTSCVAAVAFIKFARALLPESLPSAPAATAPVDCYLSCPAHFDKFFSSPLMAGKAPSTLRATAFRLLRFLAFRRSLLHPLDPNTPCLVAAFQGVREHLGATIRSLSKAATLRQRKQLSREALEARGACALPPHLLPPPHSPPPFLIFTDQWADLSLLLRALNANEPLFRDICHRGATQQNLPLADRVFALQFLLAAAYLKCGPARAGFWQQVTLADWERALQHPERVLLSTEFKTAFTYGSMPPLPPDHLFIANSSPLLSY